MDETLVQTPDRTDMIAALERLVLAESPSTDKARCDACANEVAELFRRSGIVGRMPATTWRSGWATEPIRSSCSAITTPCGPTGRWGGFLTGSTATA